MLATFAAANLLGIYTKHGSTNSIFIKAIAGFPNLLFDKLSQTDRDARSVHAVGAFDHLLGEMNGFRAAKTLRGFIKLLLSLEERHIGQHVL